MLWTFSLGIASIVQFFEYFQVYKSFCLITDVLKSSQKILCICQTSTWEASFGYCPSVFLSGMQSWWSCQSQCPILPPPPTPWPGADRGSKWCQSDSPWNSKLDTRTENSWSWFIPMMEVLRGRLLFPAPLFPGFAWILILSKICWSAAT